MQVRGRHVSPSLGAGHTHTPYFRGGTVTRRPCWVKSSHLPTGQRVKADAMGSPRCVGGRWRQEAVPLLHLNVRLHGAVTERHVAGDSVGADGHHETVMPHNRHRAATEVPRNPG